MAASTPLISAPVLSQKKRRAAQRKERRKRKRQALAQARECGLKNGTGDTHGEDEEINDEDDEDNDIAEVERLRLHEEWLERERLAQEEFRLRSEREEAARKRKEEEERMIKEEWEAQQRREQEEKEQKQQEKREREQPSDSLTNPYSTFRSPNKDEAVQKMLDEAENQLDNGGPWMNPEAPVTEKSRIENFGTESDIANCPFFLKTGACRFGDRCSRKHIYPTTSPTLMIRGMFTTFGMEQSRRDDYDIDACLEHSEEELQESFLEFYHDVLPEFKSVGKLVQFKVSCNYEPHLRGNVYIQFDTEEQCKEAFIKFNGRWYAGRQLHCEICPVTRWKNAICGLFDRQKCPKGKHCNFLHVFRNPGNEFWEADRDLHMSPDRSVRGSRRDGWHSERYRDRSWRQHHCSRSPLRSERSHSRREDSRRRSRSRERRVSHQDKEDKWSSRSRHSDSRKDRYLSRDRSRSRSRDRERNRLRTRSKDEDRQHKYRNRSEERDNRDKDEDTHRDSRERSRSTSTERKRNKRSRERSPEKADRSKKTPSDDTNTQRRHKHSKKSKKKSKKKHKKKSHLPEGTTSSESEKERESEEETGNHSATGPSREGNEANELILKNSDIDESVDTEKKFSPESKSEQSNTEINEPAGNGDISTS